MSMFVPGDPQLEVLAKISGTERAFAFGRATREAMRRDAHFELTEAAVDLHTAMTAPADVDDFDTVLELLRLARRAADAADVLRALAPDPEPAIAAVPDSRVELAR